MMIQIRTVTAALVSVEMRAIEPDMTAIVRESGFLHGRAYGYLEKLSYASDTHDAFIGSAHKHVTLKSL